MNAEPVKNLIDLILEVSEDSEGGVPTLEEEIGETTERTSLEEFVEEINL